MAHTSVREVRESFARMVMAARRAGINTEGLSMQEGNSTSGIAFRVYVLDSETAGHGQWPYVAVQGFIGKTRKEAVTTLNTIARVFDGIATERVV